MHKRTASDRLIADLQAVVEHAEALLQATSARTGEKVESVRARAEQSLRQARKRLSEAEADSVERAHKAASSAEAYVQEKPWQSIGIAAGIGFVLGLLINRH